MPDSPCNLVFVYNADASFNSLLQEAAHKLFDPDSYECSLCELTYSLIRKKKGWVAFLDALPCTHEFHLRNRFRQKYPTHAHDPFPCIYNKSDTGDLKLLVKAEDIDNAETLEQLQEMVTTAVLDRW
ncbi:hypothetical protein [Acaryochloris sp. IP29b_bin.137]|uniref:hypothetical protein n=1 Tax=Acaryochloris sp. IP29b_bin.137 TaxID=2969217 RepID=UPI002630F930|nr:hypothetical protein [Acaryochloris sp. IP29b_bin.137]